MTRGGLDLRR